MRVSLGFGESVNFLSRLAFIIIVPLFLSMPALAQNANWADASEAAVNPTMDCQVSGPCTIRGKEYPPDVCKGIYGCCPTAPMAGMATPCEPIIGTYHPYNTYVDITRDDGTPLWAVPGASKSPRSSFTVGGAGVMGYSSLTRLLGDDACLDEGETPTAGATGRVKCCKKIVEKGDNPCLWRLELSMCAASAALAAATNPATPGAGTTYASEPEILCRTQPTVIPDRRAYDNQATGDKLPVGKIMETQIARQHGGMKDTSESVFNPFAKDPPATGEQHFKTGENHVYDLNRNPSAIVRLQTPPFQVYDPGKFRPGEELKLAKKLEKLSPEDIQMARKDRAFAGHAIAAVGGSNINTIMRNLLPNTHALVNNGTKEIYRLGMEYVGEFDFPNLNFVSDARSLFTREDTGMKTNMEKLTVADMHQTNVVQMFDASHPYSPRDKMVLFPEREHYSPCTTGACNVGKNFAAYPASAQRSFPWKPYGVDSKNDVHCAGTRQDPIRVDVLTPRYERFHSQILQRITYNRYCKADQDYPCRCGICPFTPSEPCAPKPCLRAVPCFSCYGASSSNPPAATRWYSSFDPAFTKKISPGCGGLKSPLYQKNKATCAGTGFGTKAYTCVGAVCGHSWAYHPVIKLALMAWSAPTSGDFDPDVGEDHIRDLCHNLAKPIPPINKLLVADIRQMNNSGMRATEGSTYFEYFADRRPYISLASTGRELGQSPQSERPDYSSRDGSMIGIYTDGEVTEDGPQRIAYAPVPDFGIKSPKLDIVRSALASVVPATGSGQCCYGGLGGQTGGGCGTNGFHPQMSGTTELALLQMRMQREFGVYCIPHTGRQLWRGPEGLVSAKLGAQFSTPVESDKSGAPSGITRQMTMPYPCKGWLHHPDPNHQFPKGGGGASVNMQTGIDSLLDLGSEAGGAVLILARGGASTGELPGMRNLAVVDAVNKDGNYVDVWLTNGGLWPDACGFNSGSGQHIRRRIYKNEDAMPADIRKLTEDYPTRSCVVAAQALAHCVFGEWDDVQWFHPHD